MRSRKLVLIAIIGLLSFFLVGCGGGENADKTYEMGDKVTVGKAVYTALETESNTEYEKASGGRITAQGMFVLVKLNIENKGKDEAVVTGEEIEIVDSANKTYSFDSRNNNIYLGNLEKESLTNQGQIAPDKSIEGWIIFDISKNSNGLKLKVKDIDIRSNESALIDLKL